MWVTDAEQALIADRDVKVMHCPGSNLKLGSGLAPIVEMRARGICVSLGADGAACNNRLDMFDEMRLAATLQAVRRGPGALPARDVLWMATRGGAQTLGLEDRIGSLEAGKHADLAVVSRNRPHLQPDRDPWSTLVYAARGPDVRLVMVGGDVLVATSAWCVRMPTEIAAYARAACGRAGLTRRDFVTLQAPHFPGCRIFRIIFSSPRSRLLNNHDAPS